MRINSGNNAYDRRLQRTFITRADVEAAAISGVRTLVSGQDCTVTDEARECALELGITIGSGAAAPTRPSENEKKSNATRRAGDPSDSRIIEAIVAVLAEMRVGSPSADLIRKVATRVAAAEGQA